MPSQNLCELVLIGEERRNLEYKGPMRWNNELTKAKIAKAALAMSNIRDGGWVVVGVEQSNNAFEGVGLTQEDADTFDHDTISAYLNEYADPYVQLHVYPVTCEDKKFVIIKIDEFAEMPVICKKDYPRADLHQGKIYTRTRRRNENSEALTQTEMREIVELAVEKNVRVFFERLRRTGAISGEDTESEEAFRNQLGEII